MGLAEFLRARLDEDEAAAKDERVWFGPYPETIGEFEGHLVIQQERALAEVRAKRAILGWANSPALPDYEKDYVLSYVAAVYRDHPDYDQEWKP